MKKLLLVAVAVMGCGSGGGSDDTGVIPPVAHDDHLQMAEDDQLSVNPAVLANDENVSSYSSNSRIVPVDKPLHGVLNDEYDGEYYYSPDPGYHGPEHFSYKLGDTTANVDIDVQSDGIPYEQSVQVDGGPAVSMVAGDLDGDGHTDLAAIDTQTHSVIAMLNRSTPGSFAFDVQRFEGGHTPVALVLADVDGDGLLDLVTAAGTDGVVIMRNTTANGTLSFDAPVLLAAGNATAVATADIDGDGKPDVLSTDSDGNQLIVRLDRSTPGTVAYDTSYAFATAKGPMAVQAVDIDHTGGIDVVVLCADDAALSLFSNATAIGDQVPAFGARVDRETAASPGQLVAGDLDGDGAPELVVLQPDDSTLRVYSNTGTTFAGARVDPLDEAGPTGAGIVDLDRSGGLDLVVGYGNSLEQLVSGASYTLTGVEAKIGLAGRSVAPASASTILQVELDGAGTPEIVIASKASFSNQGVEGTLVLYGD